MKITATKEKLLHAVTQASRIASKNATLPVLQGILLDARDGTLIVRATNLDLGIEVMLPARVDTPGTAAVSGTVLTSVLTSVHTTDPVVFEGDTQQLIVTAGQHHAALMRIPHEEFPVIPKVPKDDTQSVALPDLISGLRSVWYSASHSSIKQELSSVYIYPSEGTVVFVATDAFRLAEKKVSSKKPLTFEPILLPLKNISDTIRILEGASGHLSIGWSKNQIGFYHTDFYLTSRVIDGVFPDYKQLIPKQYSTEAVVLKQDILNALKVTSVFSDALNKIVFSLQPSQKKFTCSARNTTVGEYSEALPAALSGEDFNGTFNHRYILDCFQSIPTDSVVLQFSGPGKPLVIRGVSDPSFLYLIMPMSDA
jgi:DNA polymerase III subunit beta